MKCENYEELLTAYAEGELAADEKRRVDDHVDACKSCRESLAFYVQLESSLLDRRALRPAPAQTADRVVRAVGLRKRPAVLPALTSLPGLIAMALVMFGGVAFFFGDPLPRLYTSLEKLFGGVGGMDLGTRFTIVMDNWVRALESIAAGSEYTLPIVLAGLTGLILLMGSWMVMRYVRD